MKKPKPRRKAAKPYTKGELNKLIDNLCHSLFQENTGFILINGFLHGLVEQNPPQISGARETKHFCQIQNPQ